MKTNEKTNENERLNEQIKTTKGKKIRTDDHKNIKESDHGIFFGTYNLLLSNLDSVRTEITAQPFHESTLGTLLQLH